MTEEEIIEQEIDGVIAPVLAKDWEDDPDAVIEKVRNDRKGLQLSQDEVNEYDDPTSGDEEPDIDENAELDDDDLAEVDDEDVEPDDEDLTEVDEDAPVDEQDHEEDGSTADPGAEDA